jgi:2-octaprenyl-6-methoxyphenol hydroxylase
MARYDIAIVGGGLVGASLACALSPLGLRIALLEKVAFSAKSQPSYDDRTLALSASSCAILRSLDLWGDLADNATAIRKILVSEQGRPGRVVMDPAELGLEAFGHVVEARVFGRAVLARVPGLGGVDYLCPASVSGVEPVNDGMRLRYVLEDDPGQEAQLDAALLVGADGANSFVREQMGVEARSHDYGQTAIICNITPEQDHAGRAFELFTPAGPFAVMPHVEGRCGLIWCVASEQAEAQLALADEDYRAAAQARFGDELGNFLKIGRRSSYPLRLVRATRDTAPRTVVLGNAAHAIHPIGAQGFNLGLRDAAVLAEVLADGLRRRGSGALGEPDTLRRYSEWRRADHDGTIDYSDGMARLFANPSSLVSSARAVGLFAHAVLPALRRRMALKAMGYRGRTPRLALGEPL